MKQIETIHAVGHVIGHDITRIIRGEIKDTAFRKGHVVTQEDIPLLLSLGKDHLYVFEKDENMLHENDAAAILCSVCKNDHMDESEVKEGKIELTATCDGLFTVDVERLDAINYLDDMMIATRNNYAPVKKGDILAGTRIIPLIIEKARMEEVKRIGNGKPILTVHPYRPGKAGIVTTGNEVYYGRIKDTFTDVIIDKIKPYGIEVMGHEIVNDEIDHIKAAILKLKEAGADAVTLADNSLAVTRMSNMALGALMQQQIGVRPLIHIACRDRNLIGTQSHMMGLDALDIDHVLAVTGDPARFGDLPDSSSVYDLTSFEMIRMIKQLNDGVAFSGKPLKQHARFVVGAAFNPNVKHLDKMVAR